MKVSLNWVKQYTDVNASVDELVARIGAQLGEVEGVENVGEKYQGVVVAKVVKCDDHPNADRLHVCSIDDGGNTPNVNRDEQGYVQVVCGAPNVREGLLVAWLPPGATVPESVGKEPFVLEARELRGGVSNGMLASPRELALSDSHEGILELDDTTAKPGDDFANSYGLDDYIIDIENKMFTHRPDCFGQLGVAREIAGISDVHFSSPAWYAHGQPQVYDGATNELPVSVSNELPALVPRFMAVSIASVDGSQPSPAWLQAELARVGIRSISMIVDVTNYMMVLTGQPLHAYDYDKVKALSGENGVQLVVRNPRANEKIELLNGKTIDPRQEAIMIASDHHLLGVGGVMGGAGSEVSAETKNIILEAATFDMYSIRRTAMAHGLFTDAVTRFNKGQSPLQNDKVLAEAVRLITELSGGHATVASNVVDVSQVDGREWVHPPVPIALEFINSRLGLQLSGEDIKRILENVEFLVDCQGENLTITAPFWRTDIETREDVVEEVGRLYGYDKLPLVLPMRSVRPVEKDELLSTKAEVRRRLSKAGANEILSYSFVHSDLLNKTGQATDVAYRIGNALSPDLQYYRLSMMPSLLEKVHPNVKAGYEHFALFEMGKVHTTDHVDEFGLPVEFEYTSLVTTATDKVKPEGSAYYLAQRYLQRLVGDHELEFKPLGNADFPVTRPYDSARAALVSLKDGEFLGIIGEFKPTVLRALKLPSFTAGFEVDTTVLIKLFKNGSGYTALPKFPKVKQDITLKLPADVSFSQIESLVARSLQANAPEDTTSRLEALGVYQREDMHKQYSFRVSITGNNRTLTDSDVSKVLDAISTEAANELKAEKL